MTSLEHSPPFDAAGLLHRFSISSPSTNLKSATDESTVELLVEPPSQEHGIPSDSDLEIPFDTAHKYILTSRGRDYANVVIKSRAPDIRDPPLLHLGDDLNGLIAMHMNNLSDMESTEVVVSWFPTIRDPN